MNDNANTADRKLGGAVIQFMDGATAEFVFTRDDAAGQDLVNRMDLILKTGMLCMCQADGRFTMIPMHNVRRIDLKPAPPHLPDGVVFDVREV